MKKGRKNLSPIDTTKNISEINLSSFKGLTQDSRSVQEGYLFAALKGDKTDGRNYISDAIRHGAKAILAAKGTTLPEDIGRAVTLIESENPRRTLALMSSAFYSKQPKTIIAVTGTNGKTSTVHMVYQIWKEIGLNAASIGTLGVRTQGAVRSGSMTTPDPVSLHAALADLAAAGVTHLAMEASSHGLDQHRLDGVKISAAGFTNLSRDHLDYHRDMENYAAAKMRLFSDFLEHMNTVVLNADSPEYNRIAKISLEAGHDIISYGKKAEHIRLLKLEAFPRGQEVTISINEIIYKIKIPLVGEFQVMNALCALGLVMSEEPNNSSRLASIIKAIENLSGVPGRLELVETGKQAVYVDYAHTPDALETVLSSLRVHTPGRLICLFGCGGDRDQGKRQIMGEIAAKLSDIVIVTDDNPRSENPEKIRTEILTGVRSAGKEAHEVGDRRKAIELGLGMLDEMDVMLVAGKGHEKGQVFNGYTLPFDDVEEVKQAANKQNAG